MCGVSSSDPKPVGRSLDDVLIRCRNGTLSFRWDTRAGRTAAATRSPGWHKTRAPEETPQRGNDLTLLFQGGAGPRRPRRVQRALSDVNLPIRRPAILWLGGLKHSSIWLNLCLTFRVSSAASIQIFPRYFVHVLGANDIYACGNPHIRGRRLPRPGVFRSAETAANPPSARRDSNRSNIRGHA
jgi:hypothetical protein